MHQESIDSRQGKNICIAPFIYCQFSASHKKISNILRQLRHDSVKMFVRSHYVYVFSANVLEHTTPSLQSNIGMPTLGTCRLPRKFPAVMSLSDSCHEGLIQFLSGSTLTGLSLRKNSSSTQSMMRMMR